MKYNDIKNYADFMSMQTENHHRFIHTSLYCQKLAYDVLQATINKQDLYIESLIQKNKKLASECALRSFIHQALENDYFIKKQNPIDKRKTMLTAGDALYDAFNIYK